MWKSMSGGGCCCSIKSAVKVSAVMFMHHDIIKKNPLVLSRSLNDLDKLHIIFCCATTITLTASIGIKIWSNSCCFSKWKHLKVCALWSWGFRCVLNTIPQLPKSGSQKPYPKVRPCNQTLQASFSMLNFKVLNGKIRKRPNKHDFYHVLKWHFLFFIQLYRRNNNVLLIGKEQNLWSLSGWSFIKGTTKPWNTLVTAMICSGSAEAAGDDRIHSKQRLSLHQMYHNTSQKWISVHLKIATGLIFTKAAQSR